MIVTADKNRTDNPALDMLRMVDSKYPILLLARSENLDFNEQVLSLKGKPYIVADYIENGWDWDRKETLIVGKNCDKFPDVCQKGWKQLDDFIRENPPLLYFKRELLLKDKTDTLLPIEYVNLQPAFPVQTKQQFDARPLSVFHFWGRSSDSRLMAHAEFWKNAARKGYTVCDNIYYFNPFMENEKGNPNKWVTLNIPYYSRVEMKYIMEINGLSKLSLSLPGAGVKCFRNCGESLCNSVMVMPDDNLSWSLPFVNEVNCIQFPINDNPKGIAPEWPIIETIQKALKNTNLYEIYKEGLKAAEWYKIENYIKNYLEPIINKL